MPTMNVNLTDEMAEFVVRELETGGYASATDVVREGLQLLRERRDRDQLEHDRLRKSVQDGLTEARLGQLSSRSVDDILADVLREGAD